MLNFTGLGNIRQAAQILILPNGTNQSNHVRRLRAGSILCPIGRASCAPLERVPFVWAKALENVPMPSSAIATPARQKRPAIKTRRLKKADFEEDFFFMDEVELFSLCSEPEIVVETVGET